MTTPQYKFFKLGVKPCRKESQRKDICKAMSIKKCTKCDVVKEFSEFRFREDRNYLLSYCKNCENIISSNYNKTNADDTKRRRRQYYQKNRLSELEDNKIYRKNNRKRINELERERRKNDLQYKLRKLISANIGYYFRNLGQNKNGSCLKNLPYTMEELKKHLEKQFEPWMNWQNHGKYLLKSWNDEDQSTWTWQLDHIIPHATFKYTSMEDEEFKQCWALSNLRPLNAKQNLIEGTQRIRH